MYEPIGKPTGIDWTVPGSHGMVKFGDDSQQVVLFYTKSVFNAAKSQQAKSRIYENQTYVRIHPPGENLNKIDRPVREEDKQKFFRQWNAFLQNKTQVPDGTPIDLLFPNNPAVADNLKAFGVYTIQQCAKLSAHALDAMGMGSQRWKDMADNYLKSAVDGSAFLEMQSKLEEKDQQIRILTRQFEELKNQYSAIMARLHDPNAGSLSPGWVKDYDVQAERIESNHPSQALRPSPRARKTSNPPKHEVDHAKLIKEVHEEDFPTRDLTKDIEE